MQKTTAFNPTIRLVLAIFLIGGLTLIWCSPGSAETYADGTEIYTLGEVIVTAESPAVESVATVREVTAAEIEARGARTLDEALELLPGDSLYPG